MPERKSLTLEYVKTKYPEDSGPTHTQMVLQQKVPEMGKVGCAPGEAHITIATGKYLTDCSCKAEVLQKAGIETSDNLS